MRLDKYLKVSRLIKRRTVANEACDNGRIRVNGRVVKASYDVKVATRSRSPWEPVPSLSRSCRWLRLSARTTPPACIRKSEKIPLFDVNRGIFRAAF